MRVLSSLEVGESGVLVSMDLPPGVQNHLMYMGFVPDARVKVLDRAPAGDPTVFSVDGIEIALRHETSRAIWIAAKSVTDKDVPEEVVVEILDEPVPQEPAPQLTEATR